MDLHPTLWLAGAAVLLLAAVAALGVGAFLLVVRLFGRK